MGKKKYLGILSSTVLGALIAFTVTTTAQAKVTEYIVNYGGKTISFNLDALISDYTNKLSGQPSPMYDEYLKGSPNLIAFHDSAKGIVSYDFVQKAYENALIHGNGNLFNIDSITENASASDIKNITIDYQCTSDGTVAAVSPIAKIEQAGTSVVGKTMVIVSLQSGLDVTKYDLSIDGTKLVYNSSTGKFTGTLDGTYTLGELQAKIIVTQKDAISTIKSIGNITTTVNQNDSYSLPSTVQASMSDGTTKNVTVTWDKVADTSKTGTFIFNGTVNGYTGNVVLILAINSTSFSHSKLDYVSLGDSLAAGQTPFNVTSGYGYTDFIAGNLAKEGALGSYRKYGVSGYTTSDVINQLQDTQVIDSIHNAEIVTIDIGANDLLSLVRTYFSGQSVDLGTQIGISAGKIQTIIQSIKTINPSAKIYIMGYYNALPNLSSEQETKFLQLLLQFNNSIKVVVDSFKDTLTPPVYVDTYESMNNNLNQYLPGDIHPTVEGYGIIAQDFWNLINIDSLSKVK